MKKFLLSSILGGLCWILCSLFLIFLRNSDFFSILIGLQFAAGIGISTYTAKFTFPPGAGKIFAIYNLVLTAYFILVLFYLVTITSGRVALTCMVLILSFLVFQKSINDWRQKCK
ncbi:MAG: hypothetical protein WC947_03790 [Elusimicrobiota bacterium]